MSAASRPTARSRPASVEAGRRRVEELGRRLASTGAPTWFVPTVGHDRSTVPLLVTGLAAALALLVGLARPLLGVALVLAVAAAAFRDAEGGRSWLRRLLPARPGWAVIAEIGAGADSPQTGTSGAPTLLLWAPVAERCPGITGRPAFLRLWAGLNGLALLTGIAGLLLVAAKEPDAGRSLALGAAGVLALLAVLTLPVTLLSGRVPSAADPEAMLAAVAPRLRTSPPAHVRVLVGAGSLGSPWFDDLDQVFADRRLGIVPGRTVVLCLQPGNAPLAVASPDGVLAPRKPAADLLAAAEHAGLAHRPARTPALRARMLGARGLGLDGGEAAPGEGPGCLEAALRSTARLLAPRR